MMTAKQYRDRHGQSEEHLQSQCVAWFRNKYPSKRMLLFSSLNGIKLATGARQGARLKRAGMTAGVADLFLSIPSGDLAGLYIEMKTPKGRQQPNQKEFEKIVVEHGYGYALPRSLEQFQEIVTNYLEKGTY